MQKIIIPNTDIHTSRLGFGTSSLHHLYSKNQRKKMIYAALDEGFLYFDTARMYGHGMCERSLGEFLPTSWRNDITISTKFGIVANSVYESFPLAMYAGKSFKKLFKPSFSKVSRDITLNGIMASVSKSLSVLKTNRLDVLMLHEPLSSEIPLLEHSMEWILKQKESGRIRYFGLAGKVEQCMELKRYFGDAIDILQIEDSITKKESIAMHDNYPVQITYGYMRRSLSNNTISPMDALDLGLKQNLEGVVLVSTRSIDRLKEMSKLVKLDDKYNTV